MKTKLPFLMLALLPFASFAQNAQSKASVYPVKKVVINKNAAASLAYAPNAYCTTPGDCSDGDVITNVTVAGINNTTTCSADGYGDYSAIQGNILPGTSYPISVTVGAGWFERVSIWIDYNKNEVFDADEFLGEVGAGANFAVTTLTGNIAIPAALAAGDYRLRVMVDATGSGNPAVEDACAGSGFGEVEDYTLVVAPVAPTGCLTAPNGAYPSAAFNPVCNGGASAITAFGYAGEYSTVNVTAGVPYTFSLSIATYFVTIADSAGTTVLASGVGSVMYTPVASGAVRFYAHTDAACGSGASETTHSRLVKCGTPPVEPDYGCDQTYTGVPDTAHNMTKNLATGTYMVANDFFVPKESGTFKLQNVKFDIVSLAAAGASDITSYDLKILADSGSNTPGSTVVTTLAGVVPTNVETLPDTFGGYASYRVTLDLANFELPVNSAADTKYWVAVTGTSASATSFYWIGSLYTEGWLTSSDYQSSDSGATWVQGASTTTPGIHYEGMMMIDAECATAAVSEAGNKNVSFYPNPVKDMLTINSKKTVETVHVYNATGQKMQVSSKLVNGKVDMSKMAPGVYIISTILADGVNESFKVIKK